MTGSSIGSSLLPVADWNVTSSAEGVSVSGGMIPASMSDGSPEVSVVEVTVLAEVVAVVVLMTVCMTAVVVAAVVPEVAETASVETVLISDVSLSPPLQLVSRSAAAKITDIFFFIISPE
jgi:hypothetical protein